MGLIFLKEILTAINNGCDCLRDFIHKNSGIFTFSFIIIFFLEQLFLMISVNFYFQVSSMAQFVIGIFALVVLTTATLEKFILEKKYQYQKKQVDIISYENEVMLKEFKEISKEYKLLYLKYDLLKKKG